MKPLISVVVPVYNESGNLVELTTRLYKILPKIVRRFEILFVDDGSTDESLKLLLRIRKNKKQIKIISFSRNFGHMAAIDAGLVCAKGKKIVIMDADLQDPPEIIGNMYKHAISGSDVVYGVKYNRKENFIMRSLFSFFYKVLNLLSTYKMPLDSGTYSMIDVKVAKLIANLPERNKFFSGLRAWSGFSQKAVYYERDRRFSGKPASFKRLFKLAMDGIFSFSYLPLRILSFLGFGLALASLASIIVVILLRIFFGLGLIGWASTISTVLFIGSIQLLSLGVIGEYLGRIYEEVKGRPRYFIAKKFGV